MLQIVPARVCDFHFRLASHETGDAKYVAPTANALALEYTAGLKCCIKLRSVGPLSDHKTAKTIHAVEGPTTRNNKSSMVTTRLVVVVEVRDEGEDASASDAMQN